MQTVALKMLFKTKATKKYKEMEKKAIQALFFSPKTEKMNQKKEQLRNTKRRLILLLWLCSNQTWAEN